MKIGLICDIKRFSVHDGPGIRTTIFLKGCPLHCRWCHNPETLRPVPELGVFLDKCTGCGACATICRCHEIAAGRHVFHRDDCLACGKCVDACLFDALELYGKRLTVAEAAAVVMEDRHFYVSSHGGATVSGGEPLLQPDFCVELFQELKRHEIHTAIETCGHVSWRSFEKVLPWTDLFLYDFKHADSAQHKKLTGQDNELIKENLLKLSRTGKPIEIRMPLVPGCNTDTDAIEAAGNFLGQLDNLIAVRLLPYHSLAHAKYAAVGREDILPDVPAPQTEFMESVATIFRQHGLRVLD